MQFAPDGEHIATTGGDGAIRVWSWRADRLGEPPPNGESLTMLGEIEDAHAQPSVAGDDLHGRLLVNDCDDINIAGSRLSGIDHSAD